MFAQDVSCEQKSKSAWKFNRKLGLSQRISFLTLTPNFKFKQTVTQNKNKRLHLIHGQLVYNSGASVIISISHQNLFDRTLNNQFEGGRNKIVYSIETKQNLVYSCKVIGLPDQMCEIWIKQCENEVLAKKKKIIRLLGIVGFQIETQNQLMKRIIFLKRWLKQGLDLLLSGKTRKQKLSYNREQEMLDESEECNVIFYGLDQEIDIHIDKSKITSEQKQNKKVEGGYFIIQNQQLLISNKSTQKLEKTILCRKTLRQKRKMHQNSRLMNQRKMKKQIEIVQSIKNTKYLIRYYSKRDLNNLQEVFMQKYDYSLQQYINYFADSLEIQHKINIAQQIVEAVIILHQYGVVHRDIKPSNFLISDDISSPNYYQIKIIDFAQSYSNKISLYEGDYACSHPYSPLQCSDLKSNNAQRPSDGIKNKEIDYWSVGMIIYEIFFRKLPISFSRIFHLDIASSWKSELLLTVNQRQKYGLPVVQDIVTILCVKMLKIEQEKRMKLETAMEILKILEQYVKNIIKIVDETK